MKYQFISFLYKKNGQKLYSLCPILSYLQLGGEKCLLFTSKLADQGVWKALFISVVSTNTHNIAYAHVCRPCYLLCCISMHQWCRVVCSSISSTTPPSLPSPAQCIWHSTIHYSWGLCLIRSISVSGQLPTCPSLNSTTVNWQQLKVNFGLGEG